ncbi:hypothetical protein [uncultured Mediterranean phage uvDeep-CGR0-AD1-C239]|nr:hypothetical protein [uncultured Mediterranean phage uvDeep-CGR0-AD1-C239]
MAGVKVRATVDVVHGEATLWFPSHKELDKWVEAVENSPDGVVSGLVLVNVKGQLVKIAGAEVGVCLLDWKEEIDEE